MLNTIDALASDLQIIAQWNEYVVLSKKNDFNPGTITEFIEKINNAKLADIAAGRDTSYSLKQTILAVLDACIWNYKTSWEEKMKLAEDYNLKKFLSVGNENINQKDDDVQ